jgi:hypothetical protein
MHQRPYFVFHSTATNTPRLELPLSNETPIKDRETSQNCDPKADERCSDDGQDARFAQEQIH